MEYNTHFFIYNKNWEKIEQKLRNTLRLNFCYLKIISFLHQPYHPKIREHILKMCKKNNCAYFNETILLIIMKM